MGTNEIGRLRASLAEHVPEIVSAMVQAAKAGDVGAARLVLERIIPALKSEELPVALDGVSGSRAETIAAVIDAIASGKLDTARGGRLIVALAPDALEERIEKWERIVQEANHE